MNKQNRLSRASSPYLKQHDDNPVDWYEWGYEALDKAKLENKPLIISIGYAACHWCHVMAHESFSDEAIAEFMNEHFVCIKIDREERPDIDRIYMEAVQLLSGRGGWPLNAFALPDGRPFHAGTYFPPEQWTDALSQLSHLYKSAYPRILQAAEALTQGIRAESFTKAVNSTPFTREEYTEAFENQIQTIDFKLGGYNGAPKFMLPIGLEFLLQYHYLSGDQQALEAVTISLDAMAHGGIYDQIGGGFARYSTDQFWKVPHFEKMLYDNGQLISLYAHAYQVTKRSLYAEIIEQTIAFAERELRHPEGGFYASIDADSEHEEGKFYVWEKGELESVLDPADAALLTDFYQVTARGNWEDGKNILHYSSDKAYFALKQEISAVEFNLILNRSNQALLENRNLRIRPETDDKILTGWNALMLSGYVNAFKALGKADYLEQALNTARFLEKYVISPEGLLYRVFKDGKVTIEGFLDDYALLADALISLYEVTFDIHWLNLSQLLTTQMWNHFRDTRHNLFFYTSDLSEPLIARKHEISDHVIPSSNSVLAHVLFKLGLLTANQEYSEMAIQMCLNFRKEIIQHGAYYSNWAILLGKLIHPEFEIAVLGENALAVGREIQRNFLPASIFAGGLTEHLPLLKNRSVENQTVIYVCRDRVCNLPVYSVNEALMLINSR
jgi:hypothetical protein